MVSSSYGAQPYGGQQSPMGGGGSFLGTAAAAAAGVVGGSLLLGSIRSMMGGGHHQAFGDTAGLMGDRRRALERSIRQRASRAMPGSTTSAPPAAATATAIARAGLFDSASNDDGGDRDDVDMDSDDFGNDSDSDYA